MIQLTVNGPSDNERQVEVACIVRQDVQRIATYSTII